MYNRKVLIDALKKLGSAKAPTQQKDMIIDPMGQWAHPGENTRIPSDRITMKGVNYPVLGVSNTGQKQMMQPGQEYNFPGADYVDEYPQMKKGGAKKKYTSDIINSTNYLFAEHPLFKKKKQSKKRIYDPNAKYYADGGESGCPEGYAFNPKTGECIEWNPTVWNTEDQSTSFDPIADVIYMNPNDRPEGMSDEEYDQMYQDQLEHEQLHRLQWINGDLKGESRTPLRMPSTVDNQDYPGDHYYNRRQEEVNYLHDYWKNQHPNEAEFIPDEIIYDKETNPAMYELPWTVEGEARDYEYATHDGIQSLFPKRQKNGQLKKAQFGLTGMGKYPALTATPFDFRTAYGQSSDYNRNPNYSLTYTAPRLFKKADLAGNPLSITLGRPYNTDAQSLTNRTLNFVPQEGLFNEYYDPAMQGASNPQYQQYLQEVSNATGKDIADINQTTLNQYNAAKNLAGAKPFYKKGIPLTANVEYGLLGSAFGDPSSGRFSGALTLGAGYAPEPGFYGTFDASAYGVFGKRKNNATIRPNQYFNKGLTRQGDMAFIPRLNIFNAVVKQRPEYNDAQTQKILELYKEDIERGTTTAEDFITNNADQSSTNRYNISMLSPELTYQVKPFKNVPGVLSLTAGLRNTLGGKDKSETTVGGQWTSRPYGNIRYSVPVEGAIDKLKDFDLPSVKKRKSYYDYVNENEQIDNTDEPPTDNTFPPEDTDTSTDGNTVQPSYDGEGVGKGPCPSGYERLCEECRCTKIKSRRSPLLDKRGVHPYIDGQYLEDGGITVDLTPEEIEEYAKGGYIIEDISIPSLNKMKKGGLPCPPFCSPLIELSRGLSSIAKNVPKTNFLGRGIANTATIADEALGQAFLAKQNQAAISAGNKWLHNWIQHPTTQMKMQADMLDVINNKNLNPHALKYETPRYGDIVLNPEDQYIGALEIAKNYMPDTQPYSFENFFSNLKEDKLNPMINMAGITFRHQSDPIRRDLFSTGYFKPNSTQIDTEYKPFRHYGSFVSRSPRFSPYKKELTTIHEGTHDWITDKLLKETGQKDLILGGIDPEIKKLWEKWSANRETNDLTKDEKTLAYLANPTEVHARIMELRRHNNLTPSDYVDEDMANQFFKQIENGEIGINKDFGKVLKNDPKILSKLMNDLYGIAIPLGVGVGGASLLKNPYKEESPIGGYKMGGEFELGDEVDEATMKELKKLGFTFEKI